MSESMRITAIMGSYRKGGTIDSLVDEMIAGAREAGAEVTKIDLIDRPIEFCRNCRSCAQQPGTTRGACSIDDDLGSILDEIDRSDAIILASPMNFGTVTAVTKRFIERLVCYAYWPWGQAAPKLRNPQQKKRAVMVASSAAPALMARPFTRLVKLLKSAVNVMGAKTEGVLYVGMAAQEQQQALTGKVRRKAHRMGVKLATPLPK